MVNARTPLFSPGFRIVSKENGRAAYHSTEMTTDLLLDDIIDIYMNNIDDELIPHIKLYAFPESEEFMATLEDHTILNAHTAPLEQGNAMLTIPEDAVCLTFQRVPDGQEAPNSPNPLIVPNGSMHNGMVHGNLNKDAVYARYVTKDDPNFGEGVNLVFAITFDENFSRATGMKVERYNALLSVLTALTIVLGMRMMGAMLISSLVIFPALSAMRVFKSFRAVVIAAGCLSVVCFTMGLTLSYLVSTPVGATVVVCNLIAFGLFSLLGKVKK
jgi:hypothetical protein